MKDILTTRLEKETINKLDSLAKKNGFTLSKQARLIIENHFNHNWYNYILRELRNFLKIFKTRHSQTD